MPPVAQSLKVITGFLGSAIKCFAIAFIVIDLLWGGFLAALAFWWTSHDSIWRGIIAVIWTIIVMGSFGFAASIQFSVFATVKRAIKEAQLGSRIFESLVEKSTGISGLIDDPDQLLTVSEIERAMNAAAGQILAADDDIADLSGAMFWFVRKMQRVAVWATVRVVVRSSSENGETVRFSVVRDKLGDVIDKRVIEAVSGLSWSIVGQLIGLAPALVALGCYVIR